MKAVNCPTAISIRLHCFVKFHVLCARQICFPAILAEVYGTNEACRLNQPMSNSRMVIIKSILHVVFRKRHEQIKSAENCFWMWHLKYEHMTDALKWFRIGVSFAPKVTYHLSHWLGQFNPIAPFQYLRKSELTCELASYLQWKSVAHTNQYIQILNIFNVWMCFIF